jgi:hypothetical protein
MNCPVGGADGAQHSVTINDITLCTDEPFTDDEVAALREYFAPTGSQARARTDRQPDG